MGKNGPNHVPETMWSSGDQIVEISNGFLWWLYQSSSAIVKREPEASKHHGLKVLLWTVASQNLVTAQSVFERDYAYRMAVGLQAASASEGTKDLIADLIRTWQRTIRLLHRGHTSLEVTEPHRTRRWKFKGSNHLLEKAFTFIQMAYFSNNKILHYFCWVT